MIVDMLDAYDAFEYLDTKVLERLCRSLLQVSCAEDGVGETYRNRIRRCYEGSGHRRKLEEMMIEMEGWVRDIIRDGEEEG